MASVMAGVAAAKKVKDLSPDFDPRDNSTVENECERMVRAAFEAAARSVSRFEVVSVMNAIPSLGITSEQAEVLINAYLDAAVRESQ